MSQLDGRSVIGGDGDGQESAAAGAPTREGGGDRGRPAPPAAAPSPRVREVAQVVTWAPMPSVMATLAASLEAEQLVAEAEGYCREAADHGRRS